MFKAFKVRRYTKQLQTGDIAARSRAMEGLVGLGSPVVPLLLQLLKSPDGAVQLWAVEQLAQSGDPAAIEPLAAMLKTADVSLRLTIARALAQTRDPRIVRPLVDAIHVLSNTGLSDAVSRCLRGLEQVLNQLGQFAVVPLIAAAREADRSGRRAAVVALGESKDPRAVDALIHALADEYPVVREHAARQLGGFADPRALQALIGGLQSPTESVRKAAAEGLGTRADPAATAPLAAALADSSWSVRYSVVEALAKIQHPGAVDALILALNDSDPPVRREAAAALGQREDVRVAPALAARLQDPAEQVREVVGKALKALGWKPGDARQRVLNALSNGDFASCVKEGKAAVEPLLGALNDRSFTIRQSAAEALGALKDPRAVEPLIAALTDEYPWVQERAAEALGKLGNAKAVGPLIELLQPKTTLLPFAAKAIASLLNQPNLSDVSAESVQALAALPPTLPFNYTRPDPAGRGDRMFRDGSFDTAAIRETARKELQRRDNA